MSFDVDVAVVGGGPAGSSTALHVARASRGAARVLVLDRAKHPREKPCAGAVSAWGLDVLGALGLSLRVPHVTMAGLRVGDGGPFGSHERPSLGVVVRRNEFDAWLLEEARASGAEVRDGVAVTAVARHGEGVRIETSGGPVTARTLAACDGAGSTVRKLLALGEPARKGHLYVLETEETAADEGVRRGLCDFDLSVCQDGVEGYYWDFPTVICGRRMVSRGIYHANLTPSKHVKAVLEACLRKRGVDPASARFKPFSTRPFVKDSVLAAGPVIFVGEAAGIDRATGEGIAQSMLMGHLAASHLVAAARGDMGAPRRYARELRASRVARHLLQSAWFSRRAFAPTASAFRSFLASSPLAREAGALWYEGRPLSLAVKARLGAGLGLEWARGASEKALNFRNDARPSGTVPQAPGMNAGAPGLRSPPRRGGLLTWPR